MSSLRCCKVTALGRALAWALLVFSASGCDDDALPQAAEMPERQFVFEGARIEERRRGEVVWTATAERAEGDLATADATRLRMVNLGEDGRSRYTVQSPTGTFAFDDGTARFDDVHVIDEGGGTLSAGTARYLQVEQRIIVDGPLVFSARGLSAHAPSGEVDLRQGAMDIRGPVEGRFVPGSTPPAAAKTVASERP